MAFSARQRACAVSGVPGCASEASSHQLKAWRSSSRFSRSSLKLPVAPMNGAASARRLLASRGKGGENLVPRLVGIERKGEQLAARRGPSVAELEARGGACGGIFRRPGGLGQRLDRAGDETPLRGRHVFLRFVELLPGQQPLRDRFGELQAQHRIELRLPATWRRVPRSARSSAARR